MALILPHQLQKLINSPISTGNRHAWLLKMAGFLSSRFPEETVFAILARLAEMIGKHKSIQNGELRRMIHHCLDRKKEASSAYPLKTPCLPKNDRAIKQLLQTFEPLFDQTTKATANEAILRLFNPDEWLCYGSDMCHPLSSSPQELAKFAATMQYIAPNPISHPEGVPNEDGLKLRCQANIAYRKYLVTEFDDPELTKTEQASLLNALSRILRLALVVDSGGKSLHGWFYVQGVGETEIRDFFRFATMLGADSAMWNNCTWARMPGGKRYRDDGSSTEQRVVYLKESENEQ